MVFSFYSRLTRAQQRTYQKSDRVAVITLPAAKKFNPLLKGLTGALDREDRRRTETACRDLISTLAATLRVPPVRVEVLAARPSRSWGELHGLYTPAQGRGSARITVWMRTAQRRQIVAFRTFLRTLLHELCHHLDYELLGLDETFHTEGFYRRESSLLDQLAGRPPRKPSR